MGMLPSSYLQAALALAQQAADCGEVPVGAVIVDGVSGEIVAAAHNACEERHDPTAHAEMLVIQEACRKKGNMRLDGCDLYVTLEPCPMCAAAISFARIRRLYFGAYDPKSGGVEQGARVFHQETCHFRPEIIAGVRESECAVILKDFFKIRRENG